MKEKILFLWLLAVVVSLVCRHFWASAIDALGRVVAMNLISLPGLAKFTAGMFGTLFLH